MGDNPARNLARHGCAVAMHNRTQQRTDEMQGSWNNDRPHYCCVYPTEYGLANHTEHPRSVYREDLPAR